MIERLATLFFDRGDIGHVALFLWAAAASGLALTLSRDLARTAARFEAFVLAIARLNALLANADAVLDDERSTIHLPAAARSGEDKW